MKMTIQLTPEMRIKLMYAQNLVIDVADSIVQDLPPAPDELDFDVEFENGDYDFDDEPYLRGRVDGWNECCREILAKARKSKEGAI
ncbi:MAG: hypothetical protein ACRCYW_14375 [Aeromonas sp.]|uniref:hypothetical protein n=1 Tax=Aeromonas sp. TaxID=647 RepID=UPI003F2C405B